MPASQKAITRAVSPSIAACELTYLDRQPIDYALAVQQHAAYEDALVSLGLELIHLPAAPELPDSVFVEDTAVVLDEIAIIGRSGVASRRGETEAVAAALAPYRTLASIGAPGTLEGGDVLRIGRMLYVGLSSRTNDAGIAQLRAIVTPIGYTVVAVELRDCLHLKTACTYVGQNRMLVNPAWIDPAIFVGMNVIHAVDSNVVAIGDAVLVSSPLTAAALESANLKVHLLGISEFQKAEAGLTCLSLLLT